MTKKENLTEEELKKLAEAIREHEPKEIKEEKIDSEKLKRVLEEKFIETPLIIQDSSPTLEKIQEAQPPNLEEVASSAPMPEEIEEEEKFYSPNQEKKDEKYEAFTHQSTGIPGLDGFTPNNHMGDLRSMEKQDKSGQQGPEYITTSKEFENKSAFEKTANSPFEQTEANSAFEQKDEKLYK